MTHLSSDTPSAISYASFGTEIFRTDKTTTESSNFKSSSQTLIPRRINQGAKLKSIEGW